MAARKRTYMEVHEALDVDRTAEGIAPSTRGKWLYDDTLRAWVLSYDALPYVPVEVIELEHAIPQPVQNVDLGSVQTLAPANFAAALFHLERPILFNRLSVFASSVVDPADGRILLYQNPDGNLSNTVELIDTFDFTATAGRIEIPTASGLRRTLVRGWFWLLWGQSAGGGNFDLEVYATGAVVPLMNDLATLAAGDPPTQFATAIAANTAPATIDPVVDGDVSGAEADAIVVHRLFNFTFPVVEATSQGSDAIPSTSRNIVLPAGAGGRLLLIVGSDGIPTITASGWVKVGQLNQSQNEGALAVFEREATGTDPVAVDTTDSEIVSWICYRLSEAGPVSAAFANGNARTDYNPPPLSPGGGKQTRLWFAVLTLDNSTAPAVTGTPAGFGDQITETGSGTGMLLTALQANIETASEDPGAFTHDFETGVAATIAVDPGSL